MKEHVLSFIPGVVVGGGGVVVGGGGVPEKITNIQTNQIKYFALLQFSALKQLKPGSGH